MAEPRVDDRGECYGTGMVGIELSVADNGLRIGLCPECGRWIGLVGSSSNRLTHHHPKELEHKPNPNADRNAILASRMNVAEWIGIERREYADKKYAEDKEARHKLRLEIKDFGFGGETEVFVLNYLGRVKLFGLDTMKGRQALGKVIVTLIHFLETAVEIHGPMPKPGISSTEDVQEWTR